MSIVHKIVMSSRYRRRTILVSIATLLGFASSAQAAIPSVDPPTANTPSSATIADSYGTVLNITELATQSGKGGWPFSLADTNILVSLWAAVEGRPTAPGLSDNRAIGPQFALAFTDTAISIGRTLAENGQSHEAALGAAAAPTARSQLAALDIYSQTPELANRVLQSQSAAVAFDSSLRYLCADKIYADLYPNGTGWNNHAYSECRPGGALDPDRASSISTSISVRTGLPPGDGGGGFVIIPCGGSIANVSSVTIGSLATMQTSPISISARSVASLSSFTSFIGRGHH